jgi:TRAP-type C4-dicarboxylate transport system substrate-binding protein
LDAKMQAKGIRYLFGTSGMPVKIYSKQPINTLADIKGKKIRTSSAGWAPMCTSLGAVPITLASSEIMTSLQQNLIDGAMTADDSYSTAGYTNIAPYRIDNLFFTVSVDLTVLSQQNFSKMSPALQKITLNQVAPACVAGAAPIRAKWGANTAAALVALKTTPINWSPADLQAAYAAWKTTWPSYQQQWPDVFNAALTATGQTL